MQRALPLTGCLTGPHAFLQHEHAYSLAWDGEGKAHVHSGRPVSV